MIRNITRTAALLALVLGITATPATASDSNAVTLWWVVFNHPEFCATSPCGEPDFLVPEVEASVIFATGDVSRDGRLTFVAGLYETADSFIDVDGNTSVIGGPGLIDAQTAEVHLVVRDHGPRLSGLLVSQLTEFVDPGCSDVGGPNTCIDTQFAIFQATGEGEAQSELFRFSDGTAVDGSRSMLIRQAGAVKAIVLTDLH